MTIEIPELSQETCDSLRVSLELTLDRNELEVVGPVLLGDESHVIARRVQILQGNEPLSFREYLFMHRIESPSENEAAHLQLTFSIEVASPLDESREQQPEALAFAWRWLSQRRQTLSAEVWATRAFDTSEYEPIVRMPEAPVPFTSVRGLTLVREKVEEGRKGTMYEVQVDEVEDYLFCAVSFTTEVRPTPSLMKELLVGASEVAMLGVRRKLPSVSVTNVD